MNPVSHALLALTSRASLTAPWSRRSPTRSLLCLIAQRGDIRLFGLMLDEFEYVMDGSCGGEVLASSADSFQTLIVARYLFFSFSFFINFLISVSPLFISPPEI